MNKRLKLELANTAGATIGKEIQIEGETYKITKILGNTIWVEKVDHS